MFGELSSDRIRTPARASRLTLNAASKLAAEVIGRGLQFVLIYLAQRALGPVMYGEFTYAMAIGFVLAPVTDLGVELIVTREIAREPRQAAHIASAGLMIKLMLTALAITLLIALSSTRAPEAQAAAVVIGLAMLANAFVEFFGYVLRGLQRVTVEAAITLIMRGLIFALGIIALAIRAGLMGLAWAYAIGGGAALLGSYGLLRRRFHVPDMRFSLAHQRRLLRDALPLGGAIMLSILYTRTAVFMLDTWNGAAAVGIYGVAQKLTEPLAIVPAAIMAAVFPALTHDLAHSDYAATHRLRARTIEVLALIGAALAIAGLIGGPWLIARLYANQYAGAEIALQVLAASVLMSFVNYALTHFLVALNRQRFILAFNAIIFTLNIGLCALLIPRFGPAGAALATLISESVLFGLCAWAVRHAPA